MMKKRSLVLVTVDCMRADHTGFMGYRRPVTPFLDSLANSSVVFTNAIVAGVPTYFSLPAILASRYPLSLGRDVMGIAPGESTITTALQDAGYETAAFLAGNPYLSRRFGYHQSFGVFRDFLDGSPDEGSGPQTYAADTSWSDFNRRLEAIARRSTLTSAAYDEAYFWYCQWRSSRQNLSLDQLRRYPAANVIIEEACSWLNALTSGHFFLWIHLMDPHFPHYPPLAALSPLGLSRIGANHAYRLNSRWARDIEVDRLQKYREEIVSLYDAGICWVDTQVARLASTLRELQRWDETLFVLTADHGEEFLEHGGRYHSPMPLSEELIRVPLIVRTPELRGGSHIPDPFSLIHLAPTLLEAVCARSPANFQGRSLWSEIATGADLQTGPAIVESVGTGRNPLRADERRQPRQMAVRDHVYKLVIKFSEKADRLYDLRNDPGEQSPLPKEACADVRARLLRAALGHLQEAKHLQNSDLALRARLREVRQTIAPRQVTTLVPQDQSLRS